MRFSFTNPTFYDIIIQNRSWFHPNRKEVNNMDNNKKLDITFPYTQKLIDSAKIPYINHITSYAIPMMVLCGLTSIPKLFNNPTTMDIVSVFIMLIGAVFMVLLNKKQVDLIFNDLYQPTENTIAHVTMDDRFYQYEVKNDHNVLNATHSFCNEITDLIPNKNTVGLVFNQNQYTIIPTKELPDANIIKDLRKLIKNQNFGSKELYRFFSIVLGCLILINIMGWLPTT